LLDPALKAVGQRHGWQLLGEFDQPSPWRGQPNPEVDKAWQQITHAKGKEFKKRRRRWRYILIYHVFFSGGVFSVTAEEVERIGKMHNYTVVLPPESGGGYMASLEATHQLHCVVSQATSRSVAPV
jgi:hypothetical protein